MRWRAMALLLSLSLTGSLAGLGLALAMPYSHGGGHSCPAGVPRSSCVYPPDLPAQRIGWAIGGAIVGVLVFVLLDIWRWWRRVT